MSAVIWRGDARDGGYCADAPVAVFNHVLKLDLTNFKWTLVDNYGDIPSVRMGANLPASIAG